MSTTARILVTAATAAFPMRAAAAQPSAGTTPPAAETRAARIDSVVRQSGTTYTPAGPHSTTTVAFRVAAGGVATGFTARQDGVDRELRKVK